MQTGAFDHLATRAKLERVGGIEPPSPAWKAGALPLSYTRGKGCWPCHSTGRRADRDYQGFGAPPPILVLRFTLLGAGNPQHCPNQHKAATGLRSPSAYGFRCSGNGFVLILPLLPGGRFRALTNRKQRPCIAICVAKQAWRIGCWWPVLISGYALRSMPRGPRPIFRFTSSFRMLSNRQPCAADSPTSKRPGQSDIRWWLTAVPCIVLAASMLALRLSAANPQPVARRNCLPADW